MSIQLFKEVLNGPYDGIAPPTTLKMGSIVGGKNIRKVSKLGGWKPRRGCVFHNTTSLGEAVLSLHEYKHPRNSDRHFLAQCDGKLYDADDTPPSTGTVFSTSEIASILSSSRPGFSDMINELWMYADGEGKPILWGGDTPFCSGFAVYDSSADIYIDYTRSVTDNRSETEAIVLEAAGDKFYVCSPGIASAIALDLGSSVNSNAVTTTLKSFVSGAWADRSASDGTANSGHTLAKDGSFTWSVNSTDSMTVIAGIMGFWYEFSFSGALSGSVTVKSCTVVFAPQTVANKWSGVFEQPAGVRYYDESVGEYADLTGAITNQSTSMYLDASDGTTSDFIYIKTIEPACGFGFGIVDGAGNTNNAQVDGIEAWEGDSWTGGTILKDETLSGTAGFSQSGTIWFDASVLTPKRRTMGFDSIPGYWYRVSWDAALSSSVEIFEVFVANFPMALPSYKGVVEFKNRSVVWGDPEFPNRLRYSANGRLDCFSGSDSGYTDAFGAMTEVAVVKRFYNELLVWKADSVYLLEGFAPINFGILKVADTIGCCAPQTVVVVETGYSAMNINEPLSVAIWMDTDGVYVIDGRKPRKVSLPVDHYFNPEYTIAIPAADLGDCSAFADPIHNEYHLLLPDGTELVYNYILDEWYPPWERNVGTSGEYLQCGISLRGSDGRYYTYGGSSEGFVVKLETDTSDKDESNADVAIEHSIKTRGISATQKESTTFRFTFRKVFLEAKARAAGSVTTKFYKNLASSGTTLTVPSAVSLVNTGYELVNPGLDTDQQDCHCFQLEWICSTADVEFELWSFLYELNAVGEIVME